MELDLVPIIDDKLEMLRLFAAFGFSPSLLPARLPDRKRRPSPEISETCRHPAQVSRARQAAASRKHRRHQLDARQDPDKVLGLERKEHHVKQDALSKDQTIGHEEAINRA